MIHSLKLLLFPFIAILLLYFIVLYYHPTPSSNNYPSPTPLSLPTQIPSPTPQALTLGNQTYAYYYHHLKPSEILTLIPNFTAQKSSSTIIEQNRCDFGINGGFYLKDNRPLGYFTIGQTAYSLPSPSLTFNGVFYSSNKKYFISLANSYRPPSDFAFQTGPFYSLSQINYRFADKHYARRHLVASDAQNQLYFFSIFDPDNPLGGPRLEDIPTFFKHQTIQKIAKFTSVLNLDGGSASAYFDGHHQVSELKPIGSFLCGKSVKLN